MDTWSILRETPHWQDPECSEVLRLWNKELVLKPKTFFLLGIWLWWRKSTLNLRMSSNYTNIRKNGWPLTQFRYQVLSKFNRMKWFILFNSQSITISITNMSAINQLRKTSFLNNNIFNELQYVLKNSFFLNRKWCSSSLHVDTWIIHVQTELSWLKMTSD